MSKSSALASARALKAELEKRGVKVSIEIQQGRPGTPNSRWYDTRFIGSMGHHIVSRRSQGNTPGLGLIKRGRSDVPGPLCNGYLGFDGVARIICMGWANHPGAGGSYRLPGGTVPRNQGRPYLFGWEIEGGITESDWTPEFRALMGKCHAATLAWLGRDERSHIEHKTWAPTRKIDRLGYSLTGARNELEPYLDASQLPEDDMSAEAERKINEIHSWLAGNDQVQRPYKYKDPKTSIRFADGQIWQDTHGVYQVLAAGNKTMVKSIDGNKWSVRYTVQRLWHRLVDTPRRTWRRRLPWWGGWDERWPELSKNYPDGYSAEALQVHSYGNSRAGREEQNEHFRELRKELRDLFAAQQPLLEAAAQGRALSEEDVAAIASKIEEITAADVAERLTVDVTVGVDDAPPGQDEAVDAAKDVAADQDAEDDDQPESEDPADDSDEA